MLPSTSWAIPSTPCPPATRNPTRGMILSPSPRPTQTQRPRLQRLGAGAHSPTPQPHSPCPRLRLSAPAPSLSPSPPRRSAFPPARCSGSPYNEGEGTSSQEDPSPGSSKSSPQGDTLGRNNSSSSSSSNSDFSISVSPPDTVYRDGFFDLAFMHLCRQSFGRVAGWQSPRPWAESYLGMVEVSHALMRERAASQQQDAVLQGFPSVPPWFRALFPYSDWGAQLNARITPAFFTWLVGPCHVEAAEIRGPPGQPGTAPTTGAGAGGSDRLGEGEQQQQQGSKVLMSAVKIDKCRYLETSGCVGMCVNLCKVPTQYFFTHELGMPLTMEPNFEDLSCRMVFGQAPPPLDEDPALSQPCFALCLSGNAKAPSCPKLS